MMRYVSLILSVCLAGCVNYYQYVDYTNREIRVTYGGFTQHGRQKGDELVFSLQVPKGQWQYNEYADSLSRGYLRLENKNPGPQFKFEWNWRSDASVQRMIGYKTISAPWLTGIIEDERRVFHTPTAVVTDNMGRSKKVLL